MIKRVAAAVVVSGRGVLACQRGPNKTLPLLWHLPGGKLENGETYSSALRRELLDELGIQIVAGNEIANVKVSFNHGQYDVHFLRVKEYHGVPSVLTDENCGIKWFDREALDSLSYNWIAVDKHVAELAMLESL